MTSRRLCQSAISSRSGGSDAVALRKASDNDHPLPSYPYATILPFTARIERAHSDRARSASSEGRLVAYLLSFIARSTSRLASRVLMDSRRSCCFLPLANPSSTLAWPRLEK